ncbi:putative actin cytoskeleton organization protein App1 [Geopyxis carbonaria]|nr:putative actin cytoskeleton organization protein App1 [Geopyxis carbonaria]
MFSGGAGAGGDGSGGQAQGWGSYLRAATQYATSTAGPASDNAQPRERGTRRKKIAGYLQAANEIRQNYTAGYNSRAQEGEEWPRMGAARTDDEELVLFPSYARMRSADKRDSPPPRPDSFHEEWEIDSTHEYDAVIEVDVRGWLFAPHSGPMSRKNRYALWVARQLCGLPAQVSESPEAPDNPSPEEAEEARKTASAIANSTTANAPIPPQPEAGLDGTPVSTGIKKTASWRSTNADPNAQQPVMNPTEIKAAHAAFNARLAPFTHRAISNVPVTVFFYNEDTSQSRSLVTSDNGHFALRAELPFIPTHVRVMASAKLSAVEEVFIQPPEGVSLISDIDDTIKHSAISMGTREVFRNTFTAPLSTLIVPGVARWYKRLAGSPYGVSVHYISNSPWQLYPVLRSFFEETGLPPGSFHLKQYSGMLQGIFEPVAERKKGTVERVISDFPHRQWLLVGDSGEADLEVYTDIAERFPDKVLAVCIRDVTTSLTTAEGLATGFFDTNQNIESDRASVRTTTSRVGVPPPPPPPRRSTRAEPPNLMDEDDGPLPAPGPIPLPTPQRHESPYPPSSSTASTASTLSLNKIPTSSSSATPPPPPKPKNLRSPPVPAKPAGLRQGSPEMARSASAGESLYDGHDYPTITSEAPPPPVPRRTATSVSSAAPAVKPPMQRMSTAAPPGAAGVVEPAVRKKEELWRRRWEVAQERLGAKGVQLLSWRVGEDVEEITVRLVEKALRIRNTKDGWREGPS